MSALLDAGAADSYVERLSGGGGHAGRAAAALRALTGLPGAAGVKEVVRAGALPPLLMLMGAGDSPAALEVRGRVGVGVRGRVRVRVIGPG